MKRILRFWHDQSGATAIEYAFIAALVSLSIVIGARAIGTSLNSSLTNVANGFN